MYIPVFDAARYDKEHNSVIYRWQKAQELFATISSLFFQSLGQDHEEMRRQVKVHFDKAQKIVLDFSVIYRNNDYVNDEEGTLEERIKKCGELQTQIQEQCIDALKKHKQEIESILKDGVEVPEPEFVLNKSSGYNCMKELSDTFELNKNKKARVALSFMHPDEFGYLPTLQDESDNKKEKDKRIQKGGAKKSS
eukprot:UN29175